MSYIFISYSHKDRAYVRSLRDALQNEGFDVWIDDRIAHGTTWPHVIQEHLDASDALIVVMTQDAYESEWVQNEVARAKRKRKPLFALLLSGDTWLSFEAVQYEDVTGGKTPSKTFFENLASLAPRKKTVVPPAASPPPGRTPISKEVSGRSSASVRSTLSKIVPPPRTIGLVGLIILIISAASWGLVTWIVSFQAAAANRALMAFSILSQNEAGIYAYDIRSASAYPVDLGAGNNWDPTVSRYGNIYFTSDRQGGNAEIYRLVNGIVESVTDAPGTFQSWDPALSRNGTLYFTSDQQDGKAEIYRLVNAQPERVTETPGEYESWGPVISPNGTLYYATNRNNGKVEIYRLMNGTPERVTETPGEYESWGPVISPNGTVYYTTDRNDGKAEIYRLIDGMPERVTDTPYGFQSWGPVIDADGTVYYTSDRQNGKRQVYRLVQGNPEPITFVSGQVESFTDFLRGISPDF